MEVDGELERKGICMWFLQMGVGIISGGSSTWSNGTYWLPVFTIVSSSLRAKGRPFISSRTY